MTETKRRFAFLDTLRFIAAAFVVFQHLFEHRPGFAGAMLVPLGPGVAGVAIFFFISGYVIPLSVGVRLDARAFLIRRLFRVYPLFLAAIVLLVLMAATGLLPSWSGMLSAAPFAWAANLLLVQDFVGVPAFLGVSWTLAIELIWYGLFALVLSLSGKRAGDVLDVLVPAGLIGLALASLLLQTRLPIGRPTMIYAAVIGYQLFRFHRGDIYAARMARSVAIFVLVAWAANFVSFGIFRHPSITVGQALGPWTLSTAVFIVAMLVRPIREARWLNHGPLPMLGAMSYSTYLLHPIAITAAGLYAPDGWRVPLALLATLLLSVAGYHLVEKPGVALGRRLAEGGRGRVEARLT